MEQLSYIASSVVKLFILNSKKSRENTLFESYERKFQKRRAREREKGLEGENTMEKRNENNAELENFIRIIAIDYYTTLYLRRI